MGQVLARLGGEQRSVEHRVFECFESLATGPLHGRVAPDALRGTTLFVRVTSSALAHELTLLKRTLIEQIEQRLGPGLVTDLRTRVG
jgi:predicted nucleic acid-binding Zn ribbon protein